MFRITVYRQTSFRDPTDHTVGVMKLVYQGDATTETSARIRAGFIVMEGLPDLGLDGKDLLVNVSPVLDTQH